MFGWNPNVVFALLAFASFLCCVTMSMPQGHLVALCSDYGISASLGAMMLSVLLGAESSAGRSGASLPIASAGC